MRVYSIFLLMEIEFHFVFLQTGGQIWDYLNFDDTNFTKDEL